MGRFRGLMFGAGCLVLFGAGCFSSPLASFGIAPSEPVAIGGDWKTLEPQVERLEFQYATTTAAKMIVYRFPADKFALHFSYSTSAQTVSEWADQFPRAALVTNGVYFNQDFSPSGLLTTKGTRIGKSVFDYDKSGLILLAPSFSIIDSSQGSVGLLGIREVGQSYPFLINDGKPALMRETGHDARRTFIGSDREGRMYLGIIPDATVTLFALMNILFQTGVKWNNVLNLDGGPSSGLVARLKEGKETKDSFTNVPNVIVVERKQ